MITGAVKILGEIPALYLDPFFLAGSQREEMQGYILIGYFPEEMPKSYDLLFLRGAKVYECVTLDELHRKHCDMHAARERFGSLMQHAGTLVYLFRAEESLTKQFISTVFTEPIIKVGVEALSKKRIQSLLRSAKCGRAFVERNDFSGLLPAIEFLEIDPQSEYLNFDLGFKRGGFLVYDLKTLALHQNFERPDGTAPSHGSSIPNESIIPDVSTVPHGSGIPNESVIPHMSTVPHGSGIPNESEIPRVSTVPHRSAIPNESAVQYGSDVPRVLADRHGSVLSHESPVFHNSTDVRFPEATSAGTDHITLDLSPQPDELGDLFGEYSAGPCKPSSPRKEQPNSESNPEGNSDGNPDGNPEPIPPPHPVHPDAPSHPLPKTNGSAAMKSPGAVTSFLTEDETEIVRLFNRLFRSFRQQAFESIGARSETIIEQCEHRAQLLNPEFSTGSLDPATAPLVLGLMEDVIKEAPFLKRAKLRNAALTLITDLYDKQYELLETHNAIDKLEQLYYRLRK